MKLLIATQDESIYLPTALEIVCRERREDLLGIVVSPPLSTHGSPWKGITLHVGVFGFAGCFRLAMRMLGCRTKDALGRGKTGGPFYSVAHVARSFGIPFFKVRELSGSEACRLFSDLKADLLISMSCPQIIRKHVRDMFPKGAINVHSAPLPRYRGLMPVFWVLANQESRTAVTVHELADGLDNGDILAQRIVPVTSGDTWHDLVLRCKRAGAELLLKTIQEVEQGTVNRRSNPDEESTYFGFPMPDDARRFRQLGRRFF